MDLYEHQGKELFAKGGVATTTGRVAFTVAEARTIDDPVIRARAVHVTSENGRVLRFTEALRADDLRAALEELAGRGELETVRRPVDPAWEVTAVLDRLDDVLIGETPITVLEGCLNIMPVGRNVRGPHGVATVPILNSR